MKARLIRCALGAGALVMSALIEANEWNRLDAAERIERCRIMAEEAMDHAASCSPSMKQAYLSIAEEWLELASEITQSADWCASVMRRSS